MSCLARKCEHGKAEEERRFDRYGQDFTGEIIMGNGCDDGLWRLAPVGDQALYHFGFHVTIMIEEHDLLCSKVHGFPDPQVRSPCPPECGLSEQLQNFAVWRGKG